MTDGHALWAARALGCDLGYMGTRFIATHESRADPRYKQMLVDSEFDDVLLSDAFTGLPANMLRPSIVEAGLDPEALPAGLSEEGARMLYGAGSGSEAPQRWKDIWSAGHAVSGVRSLLAAAELVAQTRAEYDVARSRSVRLA